ncbi:MAG: NTP/NDP exchange transporter, partial [Acidobacteriota bacterium]
MMRQSAFHLLAKLVGLRPGESRRVGSMFGLLGLIIATSYILKPLRSSLFLSQFGAHQLPYVYMLVALVLGFVTAGFAWVVSRFNLKRVFIGGALLFASNLVLFWWALDAGWPYTGFVFYVWVSIFTVVMPSLFWLLAQYVFYSNEGRRLFSTVTAGGLAGSIVGGGFTSLAVDKIGTSGLLFSAVLVLFAVAALVAWIESEEKDRITERRSALRRREMRQLADKRTGGLALIARSRYLTLITLVTILISVTSTFVDYQFNAVAEQTFHTMDALTGFFGTFFASINALAFLLQLLLAGHILNRLGVGIGLLLLPLALFTSSVGFLLFASLWTASALKLSDDGLSNSLNKSSLEILYLPIPLEVKNRAKAWLDMFVERVSRGVGGLIILLSTTVVSLGVSQMSWLVLALVSPWMVLAFLLKGEYVKAFRRSLARRDIDLADLTSHVRDQQSLSVLQHVLSGSDEKQTLYALQLLRGNADENL